MSVTYTDSPIDNTVESNDFVPSYARGARRKKPVRTWMILAPIGALALIGGGAAMMLGGERDAAPLVEPETAVIQPVAATPLESSTLPSNASASIAPPTPTVAPRAAAQAPSAPPAVQRRQAAPVERRAAPVVTPRVETAPEPTGPQPYSAPTTSAPAATPPAPSITVAPLG
ncbi:MAG: hypothetical protein V4701_07100 [Pseudomonadota bacterium]